MAVFSSPFTYIVCLFNSLNAKILISIKIQNYISGSLFIYLLFGFLVSLQWSSLNNKAIPPALKTTSTLQPQTQSHHNNTLQKSLNISFMLVLSLF